MSKVKRYKYFDARGANFLQDYDEGCFVDNPGLLVSYSDYLKLKKTCNNVFTYVQKQVEMNENMVGKEDKQGRKIIKELTNITEKEGNGNE